MNFSLKQDSNSGMLFQNINKIKKPTPKNPLLKPSSTAHSEAQEKQSKQAGCQ